MPELPEVETVRRVLQKQLIGLSITNVDIYYEKMIQCDINYFKESVLNKEFKDILRHGKALMFKLGDIYLVSHLRMEGKFFLKSADMPREKHEHVVFTLSNNMTLRYHDTRKFGIMTIKHEDELYTTKPISEIGKEPFSITKDELYLSLQNKSIPIKTALLNQQIMAGLGNIYVDEVLFRVKLNPHLKALDVTIDKCEEIIEASKEILSKAITYGGTTIRSYTSSLGVTGHYQEFLCVHTKDKCPVCGCNITKDRTNGRGTYYCPKCQLL